MLLRRLGTCDALHLMASSTVYLFAQVSRLFCAKSLFRCTYVCITPKNGGRLRFVQFASSGVYCHCCRCLVTFPPIGIVSLLPYCPIALMPWRRTSTYCLYLALLTYCLDTFLSMHGISALLFASSTMLGSLMPLYGWSYVGIQPHVAAELSAGRGRANRVNSRRYPSPFSSSCWVKTSCINSNTF